MTHIKTVFSRTNEDGDQGIAPGPSVLPSPARQHAAVLHKGRDLKSGRAVALLGFTLLEL